MHIPWDEDPATLSEDEAAVLNFTETIQTGIYAAYACVDDGPDAGVYKVLARSHLLS